MYAAAVACKSFLKAFLKFEQLPAYHKCADEHIYTMISCALGFSSLSAPSLVQLAYKIVGFHCEVPTVQQLPSLHVPGFPLKTGHPLVSHQSVAFRKKTNNNQSCKQDFAENIDGHRLKRNPSLSSRTSPSMLRAARSPPSALGH